MRTVVFLAIPMRFKGQSRDAFVLALFLSWWVVVGTFL